MRPLGRVTRVGAMALKLPDFKGRRCVEFDFCGILRNEKGKELPRLEPIQARLVARYQGAEHEIIVGLITPFPGDGSKAHVHLHFLVGDLSGKTTPEANAKVEQILNLLEPFRGYMAK